MASSEHAMFDSLIVEGYRFCRSDGELFDQSVMTFIPPTPTDEEKNGPYAIVYRPDESEQDSDTFDLYHVCSQNTSTEHPGIIYNRDTGKPFILANRCDLTWTTLSDQQKHVVQTVESEVEAYRKDNIFFRSVIMEGIGGCGKTRLMAYVMNHSPDNTHVLYLTKQNKRLQDFIYDELHKSEMVPTKPIEDLSKWKSTDFWLLSNTNGGRYACSVEKLVYNVSTFQEANQTRPRTALQWKMNIPDTLFDPDRVKGSNSNVVILLDEYTMISPPLLHKMLHCVDQLFSAPTVLIMGGDRFQLGPINWDEGSDKKYRDKRGQTAPPDAITTNNCYYSSDIREELKTRLNQEPFEYQMVGSQRCRDDPQLAKMVFYLRNACQNGTSVKAIVRRLVAFGHSRGIHLFHYDPYRTGCNTGRLVFQNEEEGHGNTIEMTAAIDDEDDEDRHLGDNDLRDMPAITVDWTSPPEMDMKPFIDFYSKLYEDIYVGFTNGTLNESKLPRFVYEKASKFAYDAFPSFMVKTNDKCNLLSDFFLKTLYNGVFTKLEKIYNKNRNDYQVTPSMAEEDGQGKSLKLLPNREVCDIKTFLEKLCVSISVAKDCPVQQTLMIGVPYRMTDTLKSAHMPVVSNGELVLLCSMAFNADLSIRYVFVKTLQRQTDHFLLVKPGLTQNRLNCLKSKQHEDSNSRGPLTYMLPMVPMVCENIYQMQGNTIVSSCFVDLLSAHRNDIYVAVSRFQKTSSIKGIVFD
jgi:hypothetical protein